jgi:hypothetical protein
MNAIVPSRPHHWVTTASLATVLLLAIYSLGGLLMPNTLYPSDVLRQSFQPNDLVNLVLAVPLLLVTLLLARRGSLAGQLLWPGALLYVAYNALAYAFAAAGTGVAIAYLLLTLISLVALVGWAYQVDSNAVQKRITRRVPARLAAGVLILLGAIFFARAASLVGAALAAQTALSHPETATALADLLITPAWVAGGIVLWLKRPGGYTAGLGLLFQASLLFLGLILFFLFQPLLLGLPLALTDLLVILPMSLVCLVPFTLYLRGVLAAG